MKAKKGLSLDVLLKCGFTKIDKEDEYYSEFSNFDYSLELGQTETANYCYLLVSEGSKIINVCETDLYGQNLVKVGVTSLDKLIKDGTVGYIEINNKMKTEDLEGRIVTSKTLANTITVLAEKNNIQLEMTHKKLLSLIVKHYDYDIHEGRITTSVELSKKGKVKLSFIIPLRLARIIIVTSLPKIQIKDIDNALNMLIKHYDKINSES
jgi:hypothetical protein